MADIGASVGIYTREFSLLVGGTGTVYAFEPLVENFEILKNVTQKRSSFQRSAYSGCIRIETGTTGHCDS